MLSEKFFVKDLTQKKGAELCLKSQKSLLDWVSTGSGSDLVRDQHAIFLMISNSYGLTRSLPLPVLTRSKRHPDFWGKAKGRPRERPFRTTQIRFTQLWNNVNRSDGRADRHRADSILQRHDQTEVR